MHLLGKKPSYSLNNTTSKQWSRLRAKFKGCRGGVKIVLIYGISILILNIALAGWLSRRADSFGGLVVLSRRSCQSSKAVIRAVHLLINVLASLHLAASNYCLQILNSPLREEIDRAYESKRWMCVGIPNIRNLSQIPWMRRILWVVLALSSLPVHLLWNSTIVQTLPANNYLMAAVSQDSASGAPVDPNAQDVLSWVRPPLDPQAFEQQWLQPMRANPINMTVGECILNYSQPFLSEYSNLALVLDWNNSTNSLAFAGTFWVNGFLPLRPDWPCGIPDDLYGEAEISLSAAHCDPAKLAKANPPHWAPLPKDFLPSGASYTTVNYCLAQKTIRECEIGLTPAIIYISLAANTLKVICFCATLFYIGGASIPLVTTGDIIESFISKPDLRLKSRCLASISEVKNNPNFWTAQRLPLKWLAKRRRWLHGSSLITWVSLLAPTIVGISTVVGFFARNQLNNYLSFGFGSSSTSELVWWGEPHGSSTMVSSAVSYSPIPLKQSYHTFILPTMPSLPAYFPNPSSFVIAVNIAVNADFGSLNL